MLVIIASCLVADSPNKVEQGLLITTYRVLMISHATLRGRNGITTEQVKVCSWSKEKRKNTSLKTKKSVIKVII